MKERWKEIKGFEGRYSISNFGRVRSHKRTIKRPQGDMSIEGRILKPLVLTTGYHYITVFILGKPSKRLNLIIHRLVAQHFKPNPENKKIVNHKDGNKRNNHVDNLEWTTKSEDVRHAYRTGLRKPSVQAKGGNSVHSKPIMQFDLEGNLIGQYPSITDAAKHTGIPRVNISQNLIGNASHTNKFKFKYS